MRNTLLEKPYTKYGGDPFLKILDPFMKIKIEYIAGSIV